MKIKPKIASYRHYLKMKTHSKDLQYLIRMTSKYEITQQVIHLYLRLINPNKYQRMIIENESNTRDYVKPTKPVRSNKTNSGK